MKMVHGFSKRLSALLVCDIIAFAAVGAIVIVAFAERGFAFAAVVAIGLSAFVGINWWLGEALDRLLHPESVHADEPATRGGLMRIHENDKRFAVSDYIRMVLFYAALMRNGAAGGPDDHIKSSPGSGR